MMAKRGRNDGDTSEHEELQQPAPPKRRKYDQPSRIVDSMETIMDELGPQLPQEYPLYSVFYRIPRKLLESETSATKVSADLETFKDVLQISAELDELKEGATKSTKNKLVICQLKLEELISLANELQEALLAKPAPSEYAKASVWREVQNRPIPILCLRPTDKRGLPLTLLHSFIPGNHLKTQSGWTHDLSMAFPSAPLPASYSDWSLDTVSQLRKLLRYEMEQQIRASLPASRTPAISARIHASSAPLLKKRAYLDIVSQNHRIALTRLLCASHNLAVESLRHVRLDGSVRIAREERICRLCGAITGEVEDLHHVLFNCKGHLRLLTLRRDFFTQLPSLDRTCLPAPSDENAWNLRIIQWADDASSATALARLAWHVSRLFYSYDLPARSVDRLAVHDIVPATIMPPLDQDDGSDYGSADEAA